jgi:hypothetical protein
MTSAATPLALVFAAALLAGCNSARAPEPPAATVGARTVTPSDFRLPEGAGCSGAIARYRAVMDNDLAMGHVNRGVYDQIQHEIGEADGACGAGQDARATALVHASKSRHGYPG